MFRALQFRPFHAVLLALGLLLLAAPVGAHTKPNATAEPEATATTETAEVTWGCPMCETARQPDPGDCRLCGMALVPLDDRTSETTTRPLAENAENAKNTASQHSLMPGVPDGLFYAAAIASLLLSFVLFEVWGRRDGTPPRGRRLDLLALPGARRAVKHRGFQFALQLPVFLLFAIVLLAGLLGNPAPERNIAPIVTWTVWWAWLVIAILLIGKAWCTVCPWMAVADWIARRSLWHRVHRRLGLGLRWPRRLRNIWLATALFVGLTWLELGYGVTHKPWLTATMGLCMVLVAVATLLVFERKAFCRYACLVGRVSGLYSMFAATELRAADPDVCKSCKTKDCFHGNAAGYPCPTHQFMGAMQSNTYCTLCTECVKTCPKDNVAWNLRPPGADLTEPHRARMDEGYLAVIMLSMSAFHGLSMTPAWDRLVAWISATTGAGELGAFSLGMTGMIAAPLIVYYAICVLMKHMAGDRERSARDLFVRFAYSLLPIALFYHLAHNLQHIFYEGLKMVRVASDPFGWGWDLFGTATMAVHAVIPVRVGWGIQVALILIGHIYGIYIAHRVATALYGRSRAATLSQVPMLVAMLLFSFQSLWLLSQPMVMRTAM